MKTYKAIIRQLITYESETWTLTENEINKLLTLYYIIALAYTTNYRLSSKKKYSETHKGQ